MKQQTLDNRLLKAAMYGQTDTVITLLERGAAIGAKNKRDLTALMFAAANGHADTVIVLLERGADVNAKNYIGWTASDFAQNKRHRRVIDVFNSWVEKQSLSTLVNLGAEHPENGLNF